jgi:hypothetical protein
MPVFEWATWWDQTIARWEGEGLPAGLGVRGVKEFFGLDADCQYWFPQMRSGARPVSGAPEGAWIRDEEDYDALLPLLYAEPDEAARSLWARWREEQAKGEIVVWITFCGFFWWPRVLLGIEPHLFAFHDQAGLMTRIIQDQVAHIRRSLEAVCEVCMPDFMTFAEDMSYNHGPMISRSLFERFLEPAYREAIPLLKAHGITVLIDSDGQVEPMIPWLEAVGVEGILPLERMAGVDVARIRAQRPQFIMIGAFDKTVMHRGEAAIRAEFERLLPVMRSGRFIPSVDHQTPPEVSIEDYWLYLGLLREYAERALLSSTDTDP